MARLPFFPALLALMLAASGCDAVGPVNEPPPPPPTEPVPLAELLRADGDFASFATVVGAAGLTGGAATLAPDDEAFALMSPESLTSLRANPAVLLRIARRHVLTAPLDPATLSDGDVLQTLEGTPIPVRVDDEGTIFLAGARLAGQVGSTPSGPVYRLKRVLRDHLTVEERVRVAPLLSRSETAFGRVGLDLTRPGTYFIPVNGGYDSVPGGFGAYQRNETLPLARKTLQALYIPGPALSIAELRARGQVETSLGTTLQISEENGFTLLGQREARVLTGDIQANGAVIHLIDLPPQGHLTLRERIDFLPATATFSQMLRDAGLAAVLDGPGPLTVFAPTEAAFDSLDARARAAVVGEAPLRAQVTPFHIVRGDVPSAAFASGLDLLTLSGQSIRVRPDPRREGQIAFSRAQLTDDIDLPASNGRLHLAASLLNPVVSPFDQLALSGFGTFRAVVEKAGYRGLLESDTLLSIVGPARVSEQYLQPGFECRARELAEDHILVNQGAIGPRSTSFSTRSGLGLTYNFDRRSFSLSNSEGTVGGSGSLYINSPLSTGGVLHASQGRLRWYGANGPATNLPPC